MKLGRDQIAVVNIRVNYANSCRYHTAGSPNCDKDYNTVARLLSSLCPRATTYKDGLCINT